MKLLHFAQHRGSSTNRKAIPSCETYMLTSYFKFEVKPQVIVQTFSCGNLGDDSYLDSTPWGWAPPTRYHLVSWQHSPNSSQCSCAQITLSGKKKKKKAHYTAVLRKRRAMSNFQWPLQHWKKFLLLRNQIYWPNKTDTFDLRYQTHI